MDASSRLLVGQHPWQHENAARHGDTLVALAKRLLAIGGEAIVVPPDNPELVDVELPLLLREGRHDHGAGAALEPAQPADCHANVVALWRAGRGAICTGYALSGGRWRSHSWIAQPDGTIIETTALRDDYFGIELDDEAAAIFAENA